MLSVVITAWNEEHTLPRAVASVKKIAGEIVLVDTESTDATVKVARELGCKVFHHKNVGIVEPVRNFSLSKAKGDWILLLDADEEVPGPLLDQIKKIIEDPNASDFYRIPRKNMIFGKWIQNSHWWPDYVYRLFKKGHVTWEDTIHSVPFTKGQGNDLATAENSAIVHHHYTSISQYVERLNRYTDHQLKHLQKDGYNFSALDLIEKPSSEFIRQYFARQGFRDGLHGLALASLQAFSELCLYLKAWENSNFPSQDISVASVKDTIDSQTSQLSWWAYEAKIIQGNFFQKIYYRLLRKLTVHAR